MSNGQVSNPSHLQINLGYCDDACFGIESQSEFNCNRLGVGDVAVILGVTTRILYPL